MHARTNLAYLLGTGVIDLGQFRRGLGRRLVDRTELPDTQYMLNLDEYLVAANEDDFGFSAPSEMIAEFLLSSYPAMVLLVELAVLNRLRRIPDQLELARKAYMATIRSHHAARFNGLTAAGASDRREFLARQPILLAMRSVIVRNNQTINLAATFPPRTAAIMLTHAIASGLTPPEGKAQVLNGMSANFFMDTVCNMSFNSSEDVFFRLDKVMRVYFGGGDDAARPPTRVAFAQMAEEAIGGNLASIVAAGVFLDAQTTNWRDGDPLLVSQQILSEVPPEDVRAFRDYVSAAPWRMRRDLSRHAGPWQFLPLEKRPVLRVGKNYLVLDQEFLQRRFTNGLVWPIADNEKRLGGRKASRAWLTAHGQAVEAIAREPLKAIAPVIRDIAGGDGLPTYFIDRDITRAYPALKKGEEPQQCDAAIWLPSDRCWLIVEVVTRDIMVPTRHRANLVSFRDDIEKMIVKKLRQLEASGKVILSDAGEALLGYSVPGASRVQPCLVQGGSFPVMPPTIAFIRDLIKAEGMFAAPMLSRPVILHLEELEILESRVEHQQSVVALIDEWQVSNRRAYPLKNHMNALGRHEGAKRMTEGALRQLIDDLVERTGWPQPPSNQEAAS